MNKISRLFGKKYREIIISVTIFVFLDTGILGLNFYITTQLDHDAHAISMATRQQTLTQEIIRGLYAVYSDAKSQNVDYMKTVDTLEEPFKQFDETLDSMIYGGQLIGTGQSADTLFATTDYKEINKKELEQIQAYWGELRPLLMPVVHAYFNDYTRDELVEKCNKAIEFLKSKPDALSGLLSAMSSNIESNTRNKIQTIRKIQAAGIVLAIANFALILFHFIRKLNRSDEAAEKAEHEVREILGSVSDGLFLMDKQLCIGTQHSDSLTRILPTDIISGRSFIDVMRPYVTEKTLSTVKEFVQLLFASHVEESLIQDLNPLQEVTIHIDSKDGSFELRHLQFLFRRTWNRAELSHVLVSVSDVTEAIQLREALKKSEQKAEEEMGMLTAILHLDPGTLDDFINISRKTLDQINQVFRDPGRNAQALSEKLEKIQRLAHKLKGDCSMIDLRFLVERVHQFETRLKKMQEIDRLGGDDFVGAAVELDRLMRDLYTVQNLTTRISKFSKVDLAANDKDSHDNELADNNTAGNVGQKNSWLTQLRGMANTISRDEGKKIQVQWSGQPTESLPAKLRVAVQDIIVQCARNAICHGIELPEIRQSLDKNETGLLQIHLLVHDDRLNLVIRDDGSGINLGLIRERALEKNIISADKINQLDTAQLVTVIFHPDFSTATGRSLHAGRGVGMSLVRDILKENKATVSLKQRPGVYTEFSFRFPVVRKPLRNPVTIPHDDSAREAV
jgi:two-component system chemotaxis sensor kinase CheA